MFDGSDAILSTVEICFLLKDNMLYLNMYQPGSPYINPSAQTPENFKKAGLTLENITFIKV